MVNIARKVLTVLKNLPHVRLERAIRKPAGATGDLTGNKSADKFRSLEKFRKSYKWLHVTIMSRTSLRVNPHSIACLNVKELLAWRRCHIGSLSDSNVIRTHNHSACKTNTQLFKWFSVCLQAKWLWVRNGVKVSMIKNT